MLMQSNLGNNPIPTGGWSRFSRDQFPPPFLYSCVWIVLVIRHYRNKLCVTSLSLE